MFAGETCSKTETFVQTEVGLHVTAYPFDMDMEKRLSLLVSLMKLYYVWLNGLMWTNDTNEYCL